MRINKQRIKLVYNNVKNLTYILICSRVYFDTKIENLYLCETITFRKFCATPHKCYMQINKQLVKLVYNDVKNFRLAAIVSKFFLQTKIEKHYICDIITFNLFHSNCTKCYMRINKQLNNLVYNDMKNLTYILISCNSVSLTKALSLRDNHIDSYDTTYYT